MLFSNVILLNLFFAIILFIGFLLHIEKKQVLHDHFLYGKWLRRGVAPDGNAWQISYLFSDSYAFEINAEPPLHLSGKYRIVKEIENLLLVELYDQQGDPSPHPNFVQIAVDTQKQQIAIDNRSYTRISIEKNT